jgi:regulator of cell morphogenesis and NO signaling
MTQAFDKLHLADQTVGAIAANLPGATAVFRRHKIDFCCAGDVALAEAAGKKGVDIATLEAELAALTANDDDRMERADSDRLIAHLLTRYHAVHRTELPELIALARKVEAVHSGHPEVPAGLANLLQRMAGELEAHMKKEELILFPAMQRHVAGLDTPITQMRHDHLDHGDLLRLLEEMTDGFTLPAGACRSWQALYASAAKLSDDLQQHIHLENNVLFPRFEIQAG